MTVSSHASPLQVLPWKGTKAPFLEPVCKIFGEVPLVQLSSGLGLGAGAVVGCSQEQVPGRGGWELVPEEDRPGGQWLQLSTPRRRTLTGSCF